MSTSTPKTQQIVAALDEALPYVVGFHPTGGGCYAIRVEVGDYTADDFREVMITDEDVFSARDWETDEHLLGNFWIGAYNGSGDAINELVEVHERGDWPATLLKIVEAARRQVALVEALPAPIDGSADIARHGSAEPLDAIDVEGTPEHAAAYGEPDVERPEPRRYVVGLPVLVSIHADGFVEVEVDTSELPVPKVLAEHSDYDREQIIADAELLDVWARQHAVRNEG